MEVEDVLVDDLAECTVIDHQLEYPTNTFELTLFLLNLLHSHGNKLNLPIDVYQLRKLLVDSFPDYSKNHILYLSRFKLLYKILQTLSCFDKTLFSEKPAKLAETPYNAMQNDIIRNKHHQLYNREFNTNNRFVTTISNRSFNYLNVTRPCVDIKLHNEVVYLTKIYEHEIAVLLDIYDGFFSKLCIDKDKLSNLKLNNNTMEVDNQFMENKIDFKSPNLKNQIVDMINRPTMNTFVFSKHYKNINGSCIREICPYGTIKDCKMQNFNPSQSDYFICNYAHYRPIILPHTDKKIGACSYLDTCRHIENCRFIHYEIVMPEYSHAIINGPNDEFGIGHIYQIPTTRIPPQWINCDVRKMDFKIFNPYIKVIMADPPWDIHMDLPYGTMKDSEMKDLPLNDVQDEGLLFLWVTGRSMELARECMDIWGYKRVEEILWIKMNQLQRLVRTGRTGHWINHSKEHCLVGIKGNPDINRNIDCDVILSEVRETSRKPDEIYRIIERMCPNSLKLEIFGRHHNTRNNWITLGNQLNGTNIIHPVILERLKSTSIN